MAGLMGVGGNNNNTDAYSSSLRGLSGLTSGFDRDGMIKSMTLRTRTRISRYKQRIQRATWKQEAYREISDKLIEMSRNYLSVLSEKSLIRSNTFRDYNVEAIGEFKGKVTASGSPSDLNGINIMGISNRASDTHYTAKSLSGNSEITTGAVDMKKEVPYGSLEGKTLEVSIGLKDKAKTYDIKFKAGDYDIYKREPDGKVKRDSDGNALLDDEKVKKVKELFNESLKDTEVNINGKKYTMADFLKVDFVKNGKDYDVKLKINDEKTVPSGVSGGQVPLGSLNSVRIMGGNALGAQGMSKINPGKFPKGIDLNKANNETGGWSMTQGSAEALIGGYRGPNDYVKKTAGEMLIGKTLNFNINGVSKSITFPPYFIKGANGEIKVKKGGIDYDFSKAEDVTRYLDTELKQAFGRDKISAEYDSVNKTIKFKPADNVSFSMTSGGGHLLGDEKSIFNVENGASNRVSLSTDLRKPSSSEVVKRLDEYARHVKNPKTGSGYNSFAELLKGEKTIDFNINGNKIKVKTNKINTIADLVREINNDDNLVERGKTNGEYNSIFHVNYDGKSDTFTFTSTDKGANSVVSADGLWKNKTVDQMDNTTEVTSLEATLFGTHNKNEIKKGENATIFYKDKNSDTVHKMESSSNTFEIGKAKFNIEGGFNVRKTGGNYSLIDENTTGVKFKSNINADKIVESVKNMIKDFNDITTLMGDQFKTMSDRDKKTGKLKYDALTDEQKEKMSEKQIEKWEKKAKEGMLFADPTLREARDGLLSMMYHGNFASKLASIGITQASYFNNKNGGLEFDEAKFRQALKDDPEAVEKIFAGDSLGNKGFAQHMKETIAKYASDTGAYKGSLVERAGSKYAPATMFNNQSFNEIDQLNKSLKLYEERLKGEEDRYIRRFARLEQLMMKANMQSGYLANLQQ